MVQTGIYLCFAVFQVKDAPEEEKLGNSTQDIHAACNSNNTVNLFSASSNQTQNNPPSNHSNQHQKEGNTGFTQNDTAFEAKTKRKKSSGSDSSECQNKEVAPGIAVPIRSKKKKKKSKIQRLEGVHRRTSEGLTPPSYLCSGCTICSGLIMFISGMIMIILGVTVNYYQNSKASGNFMRFGGGFFLMLGFLLILLGSFYFFLVCLRHRGHFNKKDANKPPPPEVAESITSESDTDDEDLANKPVVNHYGNNMSGGGASMTTVTESTANNSNFANKSDKIYTSQRSAKLPPISAPRLTMERPNSRRASVDIAGMRSPQREGSSMMPIGLDQAGKYHSKRRASMNPVSNVSLTPINLRKSNSAQEFELSDLSAPRTPRGTSNSNISVTGSSSSALDNTSVLGRTDSVRMYMRNK